MLRGLQTLFEIERGEELPVPVRVVVDLYFFALDL